MAANECIRDQNAFRYAVEIQWPAAFGALFVCNAYTHVSVI